MGTATQAKSDNTPRRSLGIVQTHATQFDGPLFRYLAQRARFELSVYYTRRGGDTVSRDSELGTERAWDIDVVSGYTCCVRRPGPFGLPTLFRKALRAGHDLLVISGYSPISQLLLALLGRLSRRAIGLRSDTILVYGQPTGIKGAIKKKFMPCIMKLYTTGHPTGSLAAEYLARYGFPEKALFPFPYNVDNDWLSSTAIRARPEAMKLRDRYGIPPKAFTVLGILKFVPREDPLTLLRGFARLHETHSQSHLVLVGDGRLRSVIEEEIADSRLQGFVHLPGYLRYSQLPAHYAMADVFVHPAVREQWGVSVNEAMVCGVPVVASNNVGAASDLIDDGKSGFLFPVGDAEALARRLKLLADSQALRRSIVDEAHKRMEKWHYRETAAQLEAALRYVGKLNAGDE